MEVMRRVTKLSKPLLKYCWLMESYNSQFRNLGDVPLPKPCPCAAGYGGCHYNTCIQLYQSSWFSYLSDNDSWDWNRKVPPKPPRPMPTPTPNPTLTLDEWEDTGMDEPPPTHVLLQIVQRCNSYGEVQDLIRILLTYDMPNLDAHLTQEITRACLRCGALFYAQRTMCMTNFYGFTPNGGSALLLLNYAKDHNDYKVMEETLRLMRINYLPLGPDVAEIILKIYRRKATKKYLRREFVNAARKLVCDGIKLYQSSFEIVMEFAANIGDAHSLLYFETARSKIMSRHTIKSGFAYAKGLLLDGRPEEASKIILELLGQYLPVVDDTRLIYDIEYYRRKGELWPKELMMEIQKLVIEWPAKTVKNLSYKKERKECVATLKSGIPKMVKDISTKGFELELDLNHLNQLEMLI